MEESEQSSTTKVGLLSLPPIKSKSAEQFGVMGMVTPPHHSASVPFRWEEEPGKPRSSCCAKSLAPFKGLDLPPRLQFDYSKFTKTPSPTTVLEGPYVGRSIFHSFRLIRHRHGHASFDGGESGGTSPERASLGFSRRWLLQRKQGKKELVHEGSFVFSPFSGGGDDIKGEEVTRITRKRSLSGLTKPRSNFWATIYGAVKQVIPTPRRSKMKN